jgi:hypothetical protein
VNKNVIAIVQMVIQGVMVLVLLLSMTWIVLSPETSDDASKAALVIVGSAVGFLFGHNTASRGNRD